MHRTVSISPSPALWSRVGGVEVPDSNDSPYDPGGDGIVQTSRNWNNDPARHAPAVVVCSLRIALPPPPMISRSLGA